MLENMEKTGNDAETRREMALGWDGNGVMWGFVLILHWAGE